jgi:hypothetical protein
VLAASIQQAAAAGAAGEAARATAGGQRPVKALS